MQACGSIQKSSSSFLTMTGILSWMGRMILLGAVVMIVQVWTGFFSGEIQVS